MSEKLTFAAEVASEIAAYERAVEAIFTDSVQEMVELAQTYAPKVTSFMVNSLQESLTEMPAVDPAKHGEKGAVYEPATISTAIIGDGFGAMLFLGYTAAYSARIEFGFHGEDSRGRTINQAAQAFVRRAAQQWPEIVARNEARVMAYLRA